ncbi:1,2-dihydroxy-3-keto-5-methylthiopentene dioxygenase [Kutzneria sp. CA-103260]|uniref:1,2-dihydroxy-3-keto-5-methylthiopentene dioxygenase n=1 Tax=Kutzneria sp. CA-103260 TaxID=2802641 RepID=UPI001BA44422|nr:cupin [Kutzneria sp. CA-103260]QUQ71096.1 cupin domain-containing protein [Kutzneria sp. CA-103260]
MTLLQVMADGDRDEVLLRTTDLATITAELAPFNITLEQWDTVELSDTAGQDEVLAAYQADVEKVSKAGDYRLVDVVRMKPSDDPEWPAKAKGAREKFLNEHTHDEDEVRFFVEGKGCFYLHLAGKVYAVVCERGDLMSVPAGTTHWFDMGSQPEFCAIRFFQEEDGWVAGFTGDGISSRMPTLDELV